LAKGARLRRGARLRATLASLRCPRRAARVNDG
jgi:hypothetical protein